MLSHGRVLLISGDTTPTATAWRVRGVRKVPSVTGRQRRQQRSMSYVLLQRSSSSSYAAFGDKERLLFPASPIGYRVLHSISSLAGSRYSLD